MSNGQAVMTAILALCEDVIGRGRHPVRCEVGQEAFTALVADRGRVVRFEPGATGPRLKIMGYGGPIEIVPRATLDRAMVVYDDTEMPWPSE